MSGNPIKWRSALRIPNINEEFISLISRAWTINVNSFSSTDLEDQITRDLVGWMKIELRNTDACWGVHSQAEVLKSSNLGRQRVIGRVDITITIAAYEIIYECKRLNLIQGQRRKSKASDYVKQGVFRFLSGKYAAEDTLGGMVGYVMDGSVSSARKSVKSCLNKYSSWLSIMDPDGHPPQIGMCRFRTQHERENDLSPITIQHILFPINN
jgi:hypothetical protein